MSDAGFTGAIPEVYDRCLGPTLFEPFAEALAARFRGFRGQILETAAGTGRVTRRLAEAAPEAAIVATDLNEPMLARAAGMVQAPNVKWRVADAQALPFDSHAFDAVVCQFGMMFFPDKAAGHAEARRVLRPGGRYVLSVWDALAHNDLSLALHEATTAHFADDPPQFVARTPFGWHDEAVLSAGLAEAGFGEIEVERVACETPAPSAREFALGMCTGSPLRTELEARVRPGELDGAVEAVCRAMTERFGEGPVRGRGRAVFVTARA